jgi:hypothetical protein
MSYGQMRNQHVTMIDELPELEDLAGVGDYHVQMDRHIMERPDIHDNRYQKHIRGAHVINHQAGMDNNGPMEGYGPAQPNSFHASLQHPQEAIMQAPPPQKMEAPMMMQPDPMSYNCVDIAKHIQGCPICSKFYHNDKTVYIIAIVVLSIVCLLLLKRVLNV